MVSFILELIMTGLVVLDMYHVVEAQLTNVALNKLTLQFTTKYSPSNAVDGDTNGNIRSESCTHTINGASNSWCEVDLGDVYLVEHIVVYNRIDCCAIGNSSGIGDNSVVPSCTDFMEPQKPLVDKLRRRYRFIKRDLHPTNKIVDVLYQCKFISRRCMEQVLPLARSDPSRANDMIIKDIVCHLQTLSDRNYDIREEELYAKFKECGCLYLLEGDAELSDCEDEQVEWSGGTLTVSEMEKLLYSKSTREILKDELEPLRIIDGLLENGGITFTDHEDIKITCSRLHRVENLLNYVERDVVGKCPMFLKAVYLCNKSLWTKLANRLNRIENAKDLTIRVQNQNDSRIFIEVPKGGNVEVTLRLRLCGDACEITEVERAVVNMDRSSLEEQAMEWEATVEDLSFSSVVIRLRTYSHKAAEMLQDMLHDRPDGLKQWLNSLLTEEQKLQLKHAGWNSVLVEVGINPADMVSDKACRCLLSRDIFQTELAMKVLRNDLTDMKSVLKLIYDMCCLTHYQRKEIVRLFDIYDCDIKIREFVKLLCSFDEQCFCMIEIALRKTGQTDALDKLADIAKHPGDEPDKTTYTKRNHKDIKRCSTLSSHNTLERLLESPDIPTVLHPDRFLRGICETESLTKDQRIAIDRLVNMENGEVKTGEVLRLLGRLPQTCICRFEHFLKQTEQLSLLSDLKHHNALLVRGDLTGEEIEENLSFLCGEIEPKIFLHIIPDEEQENLVTTGRRRNRSRSFFHHILASPGRNQYIQQFITELNRLKLFHILKILNSSKRSKNLEKGRVNGDVLQYKILENKILLMDEVDINMLKTTFIDRRVVSEETFGVLSNRETRRGSVAALLKEVLAGGYEAMNCLIAALKIAGYGFIAGSIENTADPILPCPCVAPRVEPQIIRDAKFSVQITTSAEGEGDGTTRQGSSTNTTHDGTEPADASDRHSSQDLLSQDTDSLKQVSVMVTPSDIHVQHHNKQGHCVDKNGLIQAWLEGCMVGHQQTGVMQKKDDAYDSEVRCKYTFTCDHKDSNKKVKRINKERNKKTKTDIIYKLCLLDRTPRPVFT